MQVTLKIGYWYGHLVGPIYKQLSVAAWSASSRYLSRIYAQTWHGASQGVTWSTTFLGRWLFSQLCHLYFIATLLEIFLACLSSQVGHDPPMPHSPPLMDYLLYIERISVILIVT